MIFANLPKNIINYISPYDGIYGVKIDLSNTNPQAMTYTYNDLHLCRIRNGHTICMG